MCIMVDIVLFFTKSFFFTDFCVHSFTVACLLDGFSFYNRKKYFKLKSTFYEDVTNASGTAVNKYFKILIYSHNQWLNKS